MRALPEGYVEARLIDPFELYVGPVFARGDAGARTYAFRVDERHVNARSGVHGGMLLTFADCALGQAVWDATDNAPSVTLNMQGHFLKPARLGALVEVAPELTHKTRGFVFARGIFTADGEPVMSATSLWKLFLPR